VTTDLNLGTGKKVQPSKRRLLAKGLEEVQVLRYWKLAKSGGLIRRSLVCEENTAVTILKKGSGSNGEGHGHNKNGVKKGPQLQDICKRKGKWERTVSPAGG